MRILKLHISLSLFILFSFQLFSQEIMNSGTGDEKGKEEEQQNERPKYVVPEGRTRYLRISFDPTRYVYPYIDGIARGGMEASIDTEVKGRYFPVFELGHEFVSLNQTNYNLNTNGLFFRFGVDNNFLQYADKDDRDMFFMGIRIAYANFTQSADNIILNNTGTDVTFNFPDQNFHSVWGELTVGVKTEIAKNLFLGWTVRGKRMIKTSSRDVTPYLVPGFGKYSNNVNVAANIYLSYALPIKKGSVTE
ncbi:DUF6048 family protein [Saccharicrinis sp. FJH62]|uniref:DUF6048 family protein n=1 Tax=Saccharicrinis sp. FJH62 TaxID=3344657 RepID=UPI0035D4E79A